MEDQSKKQPQNQFEPTGSPPDDDKRETTMFENSPDESPMFADDSGGAVTNQELEPSTNRSQSADLAGTASPPFTAQYETTPAEPKKIKKGLLIGLIIAGVLVVLTASAAAAYQFWYQNPQKVVSDAMLNALQAKNLSYSGELKTNNSSYAAAVKFDGANPDIATGRIAVNVTVNANGQAFNASGEGMFDKNGNVYVKISNLRQLVDAYLQQLGVQTKAFDAFVTKVDGQWVKLAANELKSYGIEPSRDQRCLTDAFNKFSNDEAAKKEVSDIYKKNQFVNLKNNLGSQSIGGTDSMGYTVTIEDARLRSFVDQLNDSQIVKNLRKCDSTIKLNSSDFVKKPADTSKSTMKVWVSRWSHQFTRVALSSTGNNDKASLIVDPLFNKTKALEIPKNSLTLKDIQNEFSNALDSY